MLHRTGARDFRIGWSDEEEGPPVVFYAVCTWQTIRAGPTVHKGAEATAALDPVTAVMRLCEQVIDGGTCAHCGRSTIFDPEPPTGGVLDGILDAMGCRYYWHPESASFLRSCEKDDDAQAVPTA